MLLPQGKEGGLLSAGAARCKYDFYKVICLRAGSPPILNDNISCISIPGYIVFIIDRYAWTSGPLYTVSIDIDYRYVIRYVIDNRLVSFDTDCWNMRRYVW